MKPFVRGFGGAKTLHICYLLSLSDVIEIIFVVSFRLVRLCSEKFWIKNILPVLESLSKDRVRKFLPVVIKFLMRNFFVNSPPKVRKNLSTCSLVFFKFSSKIFIREHSYRQVEKKIMQHDRDQKFKNLPAFYMQQLINFSTTYPQGFNSGSTSKKFRSFTYLLLICS